MTPLVKRFLLTTKENRHLEWKEHPPLGPGVGNGPKYRMVKAAVSFANWLGGFVLFGVDRNGSWVGLAEEGLAFVDPASLYELINGCIFPEIPNLNYIDFRHEGKLFALLHVPPSSQSPHVVTKEVVEKDASGQVRPVLARHALYCRQGAKSDLATAQQHQQIIAVRTEWVRDELLRRVKEVPVHSLAPTQSGGPGAVAGSLTVTRLTTDPEAPVVRVTRGREGTAGILLHEELSDGLFDEINNVVDANSLLAGGREAFLLGEPIYYRIYAERQHVQPASPRLGLLARTGLHDLYGPNLFWILQMDPEAVASVIRGAAENIKSPQVHGLIRLVTLMGRQASDWLWNKLQRIWSGHTQRPDYLWAFKEIRSRRTGDLRLISLRTAGRSLVDLPDAAAVTVESLLGSPSEAAGHLSRVCLAVFNGAKEFKQSARILDILAYGSEINAAGTRIVEALAE
jgi:hypothetical protein